MDTYEKLSHTTWECKFHVVFIPKYRRKETFGHLKKNLGVIFHNLAQQRESKILEGHPCPYADQYSSKIFSESGYWVHQGKKYNSYWGSYPGQWHSVNRFFWSFYVY